MDQLSVSRLEKVSGQGSAVSSQLTSGAGQGLIISRMMRKVVKDQLLLVSCSSTVDIRGPNFGESEGMVDINNKARCDECEASTRRVFFYHSFFSKVPEVDTGYTVNRLLNDNPHNRVNTPTTNNTGGQRGRGGGRPPTGRQHYGQQRIGRRALSIISNKQGINKESEETN